MAVNELNYNWKLTQRNKHTIMATAYIVFNDNPSIDDLNTTGKKLEESSTEKVETVLGGNFNVISEFSTRRTELINGEQQYCIVCDHVLYSDGGKLSIDSVQNLLEEATCGDR